MYFSSHFCHPFQRGLGTKVNLRTSFHPQMDGQVVRTIQTLEYEIKVCMTDVGGSWVGHFPLIKFTYNNCYYSSI